MSFLDSKLVDSDFNSFNPVLQILFSIDKLNFLVEDSDVSFLNSDLVVDRLASRSIEILSGAESLSSLKLLDGYLGDFLSCDVVSLAQDLDFVSIGFYFFSPSIDSVSSACAWLLVDNHLSGLLADCESILDLDDVISLVLHLSLISLDSDGLGTSLDLESPSLDLLLVAVASLLSSIDSDGDRLSGSLASDDSVSVDSDCILSKNFSSLFSGLDEFVSDLLAVARLVFDDDLSGLLAGFDLVSEDDNLLLNLRLLFSSDSDFDLVGILDFSFPSLDCGRAACARFLCMIDSDGDFAGFLTSSDSVAIESSFLIGNQYLFSSHLYLDSLLQCLAATALDWGSLHDNFTGLCAGLLVESLSLNKLSVGLSSSGALNSVHSCIVNSVLVLDSLASALFVLHNNVLSGLCTNSSSSSPSSGNLFVLSNVESLVFESSCSFLLLDCNDLTSPSVYFLQGASTWLLVNSDDLSGLCASDNSVLQSHFLVLGFDISSSDLNSSESLSYLVAVTRLSLNNNLICSLANFLSVVPNLVLVIDLNSLFGNFNSSDFVLIGFGSFKCGTPSLNSLLGARTRLVVDDNFSSLLANSKSVSVDGNSVVDSVSSDLESNSMGSSSVNSKRVSPLSNLGSGARARFVLHNNNFSGSGTSRKSGSDDSGVVVGLGDSDLSFPNSNLSLNFVAFARLVSDNNYSLARLGANLGSLGPDCKSLVSVFSSLDSDLSKLDTISSGLAFPFSDVSESARAWLVLDNDNLSGLSTSGDSAFEDVLLSDEALSLDLDLDALDLSLLNSWAIAVRVLDSVQSDLVSIDLGSASLGLHVKVCLDFEFMNDRWLNNMSVFETAMSALAF